MFNFIQMKKIILLLTGLILLTVASCSKHDHEVQPNQGNNNQPGQPDAKTVVTDRKVSSVTPNSIKFDTSRSDIEAGDIIVSGVAENAPYGFLRKVTSVTTDNGQTTVETTNATLQEALANTIKEGDSVGHSFSFTFDSANFTHNRLASKSHASTQSRLGFSLPVDQTFQLEPGATVHVGGTLSIVPQVTGSLEFTHNLIGLPKLKEFLFSVQSTNDLDVKVNADLKADFKKEWQIFTSPSYLVTIPMGAVPVSLWFKVKATVGVKGKLDADWQYAYHNTSVLTEGVQYLGDWSLLGNNGLHMTLDSSHASKNVTGNCTVYVKLEVDMSLYDEHIATAGVWATPQAAFNAVLTGSKIDWSAKGSVGTGASFSALTLGKESLVDKSWDHLFNIPEWTIAQGSYSFHKNNFYLEDNGVTIGCPAADWEDTGIVNGITYTKRRANEIRADNASTTCTSGITDMAGLLSRTSYLKDFNGDISSWDVSDVTDMEQMFAGNGSFNQDISNWDVGRVVSMESMFQNATAFNQDIGRWNVGHVVNMVNMFANASAFNHDIGGWDVSKVVDMEQIFANASSFNQDIGAWNVHNVLNMRSMFYEARLFNQNIGRWNVGKVTNMESMFNGASSFNGNIGSWDVSKVTNMEGMFYDASSFNGNIGSWDVGNVTDMNDMFEEAISFNQDIGKWNVSHVTNMSGMFSRATSFNQDLSGWCVKKIPQEQNSFSNASPLTDDHKPVWGTCPN